MATPQGKDKDKDKEAASAKRKDREELFPVSEDDIPKAVVTRIAKSKVRASSS